uniref:Uncharacterized protein n=1 Tax=Arundo donax TaxID=35708 RepID=A0A0A8YGS0_ARUDO
MAWLVGDFCYLIHPSGQGINLGFLGGGFVSGGGHEFGVSPGQAQVRFLSLRFRSGGGISEDVISGECFVRFVMLFLDANGWELEVIPGDGFLVPAAGFIAGGGGFEGPLPTPTGKLPMHPICIKCASTRDPRRWLLRLYKVWASLLLLEGGVVSSTGVPQGSPLLFGRGRRRTEERKMFAVRTSACSLVISLFSRVLLVKWGCR